MTGRSFRLGQNVKTDERHLCNLTGVLTLLSLYYPQGSIHIGAQKAHKELYIVYQTTIMTYISLKVSGSHLGKQRFISWFFGNFHLTEIDWKTFSWTQSAGDFLDVVLDVNWWEVVVLPAMGNNTWYVLFTITSESVINFAPKDAHHAKVFPNLLLRSRNKKFHLFYTVHYDWNKADWDCYRDEVRLRNSREVYDSGNVNTVLQNNINAIWTQRESSAPRNALTTN